MKSEHGMTQVDIYTLVGWPTLRHDKDYPKCRHASCPACSCDGTMCMAENMAESAPHLVIEYRHICPQLYRRAQVLMGRVE